MQRVLVIGSPGAGKSTFARKLALRTGLPLVHLDAEFWLPGWTERDAPDWQRKLGQIAARDRWIIDGNYGRSLAVRFARADTVIHLDYSTARCLWRALKRVLGSHGRVRADSAPGCPERLDFSFLLYIARFRASRRKKIIGLTERFGGRVHRFGTPRDAEAFLRALG